MERRQGIKYIVTGAVIATLYATLTYLCNFFGLAYGPIQLRISEVLTILPIFTPAAVPGLTVGCFISNIGSFNIADLLFGTLATFFAAGLTRVLRDKCVKGLPIFAFLPPIIINAVVIGFEIAVFYLEPGNFLWGFLISAFEVGLGQTIVCLCFGIPFYYIIKKYKIFK